MWNETFLYLPLSHNIFLFPTFLCFRIQDGFDEGNTGHVTTKLRQCRRLTDSLQVLAPTLCWYFFLFFLQICRYDLDLLLRCLTFLLIFDNPLFSTLTHYPSYFARGSTVPTITDFGWNCCTLRMKHLSKRFHTFENTIFLAQLSSSRLLMPRGHAWTIATTFGASWKSWPTKATKNGFFH